MKIIPIRAKESYEVIIGRGLLATVGEKVKSLVPKAQKLVIVSDSNVAALYGETVLATCKDAGFSAELFVFPAGEASKNGETYLSLLEFLAEERLTRSDALVALGGGVTGDLTGFTAATFLRGIAYIQMPTSLLAAVDSSVGGKTAIDLEAGKNLAGAFYQPKLVLCDVDTFETLPRDIFCDGMAEVIKYAMIDNAPFLDKLQTEDVESHIEDFVATCVAMKGDIVARDEFDRGDRQLLNLGHTLGHGVEHCSHFTLSHGKSVAIGMTMICRSAVKKGLCPEAVLEKLLGLLNRYELPTDCPYKAEEILRAALGDKKRSGGEITLVIPREVGKSELHTVDIEELSSWIEEGICP